MDIVTAYPGQQVQLSYNFLNPDNRDTYQPGSVLDHTARMRVYNPSGSLVADSQYHTASDGSGAQPASYREDILGGQLLSTSGTTYLYLLSIPEDWPLGSYVVEFSANVQDYPVSDRFAQINLTAAPRIQISGQLQETESNDYAISFWFRTAQAQEIKLLKSLVDMMRLDKIRRPIEDSRIFASARHEDGATTDLLPLSTYTLRPGWTHITVSKDLFQLPIINRARAAAPYQNGPQWANPYYQDHLVYSIDNVDQVNPFAWSSTYGPGPLFYIYLNDPHWGCANFKVGWERDFRVVGQPNGTQLNEGDPRIPQIICRPDWLGIIDYFAFAQPAELVVLSQMRNQRWRPEYQINYTTTSAYFNYPLNGPGPENIHLLTDFMSAGPSPYYNQQIEVTKLEPRDNSFNRFAAGYNAKDWRVRAVPPADNIERI